MTTSQCVRSETALFAVMSSTIVRMLSPIPGMELKTCLMVSATFMAELADVRYLLNYCKAGTRSVSSGLGIHTCMTILRNGAGADGPPGIAMSTVRTNSRSSVWIP